MTTKVTINSYNEFVETCCSATTEDFQYYQNGLRLKVSLYSEREEPGVIGEMSETALPVIVGHTKDHNFYDLFYPQPFTKGTLRSILEGYGAYLQPEVDSDWTNASGLYTHKDGFSVLEDEWSNWYIYYQNTPITCFTTLRDAQLYVQNLGRLSRANEWVWDRRKELKHVVTGFVLPVTWSAAYWALRQHILTGLRIFNQKDLLGLQ